MPNRFLASLATLLALVAPAIALEIKSDVRPGALPSLTAPGEIAINRADRTLFFRNADGTMGRGSLLNALPSGRKAVEQGDAGDLSAKPEADGGQFYGFAEGMKDEVNVMAFIPPTLRPAIRDYTSAADLTAYVRKALATGKRVRFPSGRYPVCDSLPLASGQEVTGPGVVAAYLWVGACFNMSASAVVPVALGDSSGWDGVGIRFDQPSVTSRAALRKYPWALDISAATRFKIGRIRIGAAWNGIKCLGNCGGFDGNLLEIGAFNTGAVFDGPLDFVHIGTAHPYPFDIAHDTNLLNLYYDGSTVGAEFGSIDGLDVKTMNVFSNKVIGNANGNPGAARQIGLMQLDGDNSTFESAAGDWQIGLVSTTKLGGKTVPAFLIAAGNVTVASMRTWGANNGAFVKVTGGTLAINGGTMEQRANQPVAEVTGGRFVLQGAALVSAVGTDGPARTVPFVRQSGSGILVATGNTSVLTANDNGGPLFGIGSDNQENVLTGNVLAGFNISLPTSPNFGFYGGNVGIPTPYANGVAVGAEVSRQIKGSFASGSAGGATFPHNVPAMRGVAPQGRIIAVDVNSVGSGGQKTVYPGSVTWDGSNIYLALGNAAYEGSGYEITVRYR